MFDLKTELDIIIKESAVEPREYQKRIVLQTVEGFITKGYNSVLVESPTGSGKTVISLLACKMLQKLFGIKIGWVAHRKFLLRQAENENKIKSFNNNISFISMFEKSPKCQIDMLVIDECQHDAAASCMHLHNLLKPKYILGMSAFPFRTDRVKLCFDKKISDASISELIKLGYLSPYEHFTITDKWSPSEVVKFYLKEKEKWGQFIMYYHTVAECMEAYDLLRNNNVRVEVVTGQTKENQQISRFKKGESIGLVNCMKLTEGLDLPQLKTVFIRDACKSVTVQCGGRVFRKYESIPVKYIVQSNRTKCPFLKIALPVKQHIWEYNRWTSLTPNNNANVGQNNMVQAIARIEVKLPDILTVKKNARRRRANEDLFGPLE